MSQLRQSTIGRTFEPQCRSASLGSLKAGWGWVREVRCVRARRPWSRRGVCVRCGRACLECAE